MARSSRRFDSWHVMLKITSRQFDPDEEGQTGAQKILYSMLNIILIMLDGGVSRGDIKRGSLPKYYEKLNQKLSELMDVLECSKDSIWLAIYMIEEGAPGCPLAVSAFRKLL